MILKDGSMALSIQGEGFFDFFAFSIFIFRFCRLLSISSAQIFSANVQEHIIPNCRASVTAI